MTEQEVFNQVWKYFIVEKHPQAKDSETGHCVFYNEDTNSKCAIACLFSDHIAQKLQKHYPGYTVMMLRHAILEYPLSVISDCLNKIDVRLLLDLQSSHDIHFSVMEYKLKEIAIKYNLFLLESI